MRIFKKYVVQIPKKYKKNLSAKWKSDKSFYEIRCELCEDYRCRDCLFYKCKKSFARLGCVEWIEAILPKRIYEMYFEIDIPKEFFKVLRERAKQYIEWI